jgi:hypothetical protein
MAGDDKPQVDTSANAPTTAASEDRFKLLEPLVPYIAGEWKIDSKWTDGNPLKARATYQWGVGKKFIVARTFANGPQGEYQRYETIFGVKDGKLTAWGFTFDGSADSGTWTIDGKKLSNSKPMNSARGGGTGTLHQSIELVEPNRMHWLVSFEKDGETKQLMDGYWIREGSASTAK